MLIEQPLTFVRVGRRRIGKIVNEIYRGSMGDVIGSKSDVIGSMGDVIGSTIDVIGSVRDVIEGGAHEGGG